MYQRSHKQFSRQAFFRKTDPHLLCRFFHEKYNVDPDLNEIPEENREDHFNKILDTLDENPRTEAIEDLSTINDMTHDRARALLQQEAILDQIDGIEGLPSHDTAMTMFLDYPELFDKALAIFTIEELTNWRQYQSREKAPVPRIDHSKIHLIEKGLSDYFKNYGMGDHCYVQHYGDSERHVFEFSFENFPRAEDEFDKGILIRKVRRPVVHSVAILYPEYRTIRIKATRINWIEEIRNQVGYSLYQDADFFDVEDDKIIDLSSFRKRPQFITDPFDEIQFVHLVSLKIRSHFNGGIITTIDAQDTDSIYETVIGEFGIDLNNCEIIGIKIRFKFPGKGNAGQRTIEMNVPNRCNLCDTQNDRIIDRYLRKWKIMGGNESLETPVSIAG